MRLSRLTLPNLLSLLRMGLVPLFIIAVLDGESGQALLIFVVAGITDALDGFIARLWRQQSLLGAYLDPIADKLLLMTAYVMLAIPGQYPGVTIPVWVTVLVIARDVLIVIVALILHLALGVKRFPPTRISKLTTVFQVVTIGLVLLSGVLPRMVDVVAEVAVLLTAALTVISGFNYIYRANHLAEGAPTRPAPPQP
jgi:cardiolipin synthase